MILTPEYHPKCCTVSKVSPTARADPVRQTGILYLVVVELPFSTSRSIMSYQEPLESSKPAPICNITPSGPNGLDRSMHHLRRRLQRAQVRRNWPRGKPRFQTMPFRSVVWLLVRIIIIDVDRGVVPWSATPFTKPIMKPYSATLRSNATSRAPRVGSHI